MRLPRISFYFSAMICILAWLDWTLCLSFLTAATVHECGHLIVMKFWRVPVGDVTVGVDGVKIRAGIMTNGREIWCAAAGPAMGFLLAVFAMRIFPKVAVVSALLTAVNMLPLYPLDGGRILRAALCIHMEENRVRQVIRGITWFTCSVLMLLACWATVVLQIGVWPIAASLILLCRAGSGE